MKTILISKVSSLISEFRGKVDTKEIVSVMLNALIQEARANGIEYFFFASIIQRGYMGERPRSGND